jgi:EAL domain-containing protein (putative c-di-GMP-specific phosphodiesterase class I)
MRFPIDTLKIDMSFIRSIPHDRGHVAITSAIIAMAQSLNLCVVAEGVENESQVAWLKQNGCQILQGYYFSRPVPPQDLPGFCAATSGSFGEALS